MSTMLYQVVFSPSFASLTPNKILKIHSSNTLNEITSMHNSTKKYSSLSSSQVLAVCPPKQSDYPTIDHYQIEHEQNLKRLKGVLRADGENASESLEMIDAIQRLGIDYHFQEEIEEILQRIYKNCSLYNYYGRDLHEVALCFRLLRQEGYCAPTEAFKNFKDITGKFSKELSKDIKGLMELYEASQLSIEGDDILDEAGDFSAKLLKSLYPNDSTYQAGIIKRTLDRPHHKSLPRPTAMKFINTSVGGENEWTKCLRQFAKLDFNIAQSLHQKEISQILKWWGELGLTKELKGARDQPLKWYTWSTAILDDQSLSQQRIDLTKPIALIYIIDDIFDVCGGLDELTFFTKIIERWNYEDIEQLPNYMKACFVALDNITTEISLNVYKKHGWNPIESLRKSWVSLCKAFLVEAKWFASGHLPGTEEYLRNGIVSSGVHVVLVHIFFLLGQNVTKETLELIDNTPRIFSSTATILRLSDDLGNAQDESQDGYDGSYVEYYVNQHRSSTVSHARKEVVKMISDAWKILNEECLYPNPFSRSFRKGCLNLARMVPLMYSYDDDHRLPSLEEYMKSLLIEKYAM